MQVGDGHNTRLWRDPWFEGVVLSDRFGRLFNLAVDKNCLVLDVFRHESGVNEDEWRWTRRLFQ